jgi:hypothetical protein
MKDPDRVVALADGEIAEALSRLTVRFGPQHAIVETFRTCESQIWEWALATNRLPAPGTETEADAESRVQEVNAAARAFGDAWARFLDAAANTAGARLP